MTNSQAETSPIEGVRTGVDALMTVEPGELSDGELASTIVQFRRELDRLDAVLAGHRRGVGAEDGYESTPSWLRARSEMRAGDVHAAIAAGELGEVLPDIHEAWRAGRISSGAVRIMRSARVPGFDDELDAVEPELLAAALKKDLRSLGRMASYFKQCARRDGGLLPERDGVMASPRATVVVDWATFLTHLNREAFVRFGQIDGSFIGGLDPTDVETLL